MAVKNLAAIAAALVVSASASPSCLDTSGNAVDWWFVYKFHGGVDYAFVSSDDANVPAPLQLTGASLDSAYGPLGYTLTQVIDGRSTLARVQWNDELPSGGLSDEELQLLQTPGSTASGSLNLSATTYGHTKGIFATDASGGFLLVHSLPKAFDLTGSAFTWGGASTTYGQSFLCVSLDAANIEEVAYAYQFNDIQAYDSAVPASLSSKLPNTVALVAGQRQSGSYHVDLTSRGGAVFTQFAKSGSWGQDLYEDLVQPTLGIDAWVETWRRSPQMATYCRNTSTDFPWDSMNVEYLGFVDASGAPAPLKYTQDHAKWLVTAPNATTARSSAAAATQQRQLRGSAIGTGGGQPKWTCVGDINRMTSQWARGGGTVCSAHGPLYEAMVATVTQADVCEP